MLPDRHNPLLLVHACSITLNVKKNFIDCVDVLKEHNIEIY